MGGLPIHQCVLAMYTQYFPEFCEQNHRHIILGWDLNP